MRVQVQQLLDDHQTLTQGLQFSPFKKIFDTEIDEWDGHLRLMNKILEVCALASALPTKPPRREIVTSSAGAGVTCRPI